MIDRFIPACAGNASRTWSSSNRTPVHPRVCGERCYKAMDRGRKNGSSPRVRGTRSWIDYDFWPDRFIPACAGNAPATESQCRPLAVHPRVCGERS